MQLLRAAHLLFFVLFLLLFLLFIFSLSPFPTYHPHFIFFSHYTHPFPEHADNMPTTSNLLVILYFFSLYFNTFYEHADNMPMDIYYHCRDLDKNNKYNMYVCILFSTPPLFPFELLTIYFSQRITHILFFFPLIPSHTFAIVIILHI